MCNTFTDKPYYTAYDERYKIVHSEEGQRWGVSPSDSVLTNFLTEWVDANGLCGKRVIEFACGEGGAGVILSKLGCRYCGVDVSEAGIKKTRETLCDFPDAELAVRDMVKDSFGENVFDAALDIMGIHMLVTNQDRDAYLRNAFDCLKPGAPMLFINENYRNHAYIEEDIATFEEWRDCVKHDYDTPQEISSTDDSHKFMLRILPARARSREGYQREIEKSGFSFDNLRTGILGQGATINVHKPLTGH